MDSKKILIVDDDENILDILKGFLTVLNYQVRETKSGLEALKLLRSEPFDLLLTDIVMPDISGVGLISIVKREFSHLPVIAMSGFGEQVMDLVQEARTDYFLEKPFDMEQLFLFYRQLFYQEKFLLLLL